MAIPGMGPIKSVFAKLKPKGPKGPECKRGLSNCALLPGQKQEDCFECFLVERFNEERAAMPAKEGERVGIGVLLCVKGMLVGQAFPINLPVGGTFVVGAAPDCDLTLPDESVSRRHATITRHLNKLIIRDEDSATHSAIRGEPTQRWRVLEPDKDYWFHDGYTFRLGDVELLFRATEGERLGAGDPPRLMAAGEE